MQSLLKKIEDLSERQKKGDAQLAEAWAEFGKAVRETREISRVTIVELATKIGVSKSDLSYRETGLRGGDLETARKVAEALK